MALGGLVLSPRGHIPQRTCVGCRAVTAQRSLVRISFLGPRLVTGRGLGRGAYVHPTAACLEAAAKGGIARSLRRAVPPEAVRRLATDLSPFHDNSPTTGDRNSKNAAGLDAANAVESPSRITAKDDRSEDASV